MWAAFLVGVGVGVSGVFFVWFVVGYVGVGRLGVEDEQQGWCGGEILRGVSVAETRRRRGTVRRRGEVR